MTFQELILALNKFWADRGCLIQQPYDLEVGAGTFNPATFLRVLGPEPYSVAYVEPSRRPTDGRYGKTPTGFSIIISTRSSLSLLQQIRREFTWRVSRVLALTRWITIYDLSRTTGNRPPWAPRDWVGRFGSMEWK